MFHHGLFDTLMRQNEKHYNSLIEASLLKDGSLIPSSQFTIALKCRNASLNFVVAHFTQPPSPEASLSHLQQKFPGGEFYSTYEAGFSGTSAHEQLCKLGIKNIVVHPGDIPRTDKEKKNKTEMSMTAVR